MIAEISESRLARLGEFIAQTLGLSFPAARWGDLRRGLAGAAREMGFENPADCAEELLSKPLTKNQSEILISHLTVGETYFFREPKSFDLLTNELLPPLMQARRQSGEKRLRVWSAACCTGEEPYSIAIALRRAIPDFNDWNITLLASDINPRFLRQAAAGIYGSWSFRNSPHWLKAQYFNARPDGRFEIRPEIKNSVSFTCLNLADDCYPSLTNDTMAMDIIFCRNVLMYFTPEQTKKVIRKFHRAQLEGGWLVVGPCESPGVFFPPYVNANFSDAILYRKTDRKAEPVPMQPAQVQPAPLLPRHTLPNVMEFVAEKFTSEPIAEPPPPLRDPLREAGDFYAQGRYGEAAALLRDVLAGDSRNSHAFSLLARSLANEGRLGEALECCDAWVASDKMNPPSHYFRALVLQEQALHEEAGAALRRAIYLDPDFTLAHFTLAGIARQQGRHAEASRSFANALHSLRDCAPGDIVPASEGVTAERFAEIVSSLMNLEATA